MSITTQSQKNQQKSDSNYPQKLSPLVRARAIFFAPMMAGGAGNQRGHLDASSQSKKCDFPHQKSIQICP